MKIITIQVPEGTAQVEAHTIAGNWAIHRAWYDLESPHRLIPVNKR